MEKEFIIKFLLSVKFLIELVIFINENGRLLFKFKIFAAVSYIYIYIYIYFVMLGGKKEGRRVLNGNQIKRQ